MTRSELEIQLLAQAARLQRVRPVARVARLVTQGVLDAARKGTG